jgi:hypothetical protein
MTLRCKPDDIAIVLDGPYVGYYVTVLRFLGTAMGRYTDGSLGVLDNCWETTLPRGAKRQARTNGKCAFTDKDLLPVSPGDLNETEETEKELGTLV